MKSSDFEPFGNGVYDTHGSSDQTFRGAKFRLRFCNNFRCCQLFIWQQNMVFGGARGADFSAATICLDALQGRFFSTLCSVFSDRRATDRNENVTPRANATNIVAKQILCDKIRQAGTSGIDRGSTS
jgi:hypothetical protein